ncbi:MAG: hypothetical protein HYT43_01335 [Candidatus Taylorbacteria bacterium]|nr:hypothetical protein [Candidatus Taylorbacteria bacterium]
MSRRFLKSFYAHTALSLCLSFIAGSLIFLTAPRPVQAACPSDDDTIPPTDSLTVPVFDSSNFAVNTLSSQSLQSLYIKECVSDGLFINAVVKPLIRAFTESIVDWIESGFEGGPTFVDDPEAFFADTAGNIIGEYISGTALGFLCDPFKLNIRLSLRLAYSRQRYIGCTLDDIVGNVGGAIEDFTGGDFSKGGWDAWAAMTTRNVNNPYGSHLETEADLAARVSSRQNIELMKLNWGQGFFSIKGADGKIRTPGAVIEGQLNTALGGNLRQLELADELDEIIGALANQLIKTVIQEGLGR